MFDSMRQVYLKLEAKAIGFGFKLPTAPEIAHIRDRLTSQFQHWTTQKIRVVHGYINFLIYRAVTRNKVVRQVRRATADRPGFHKIVGCVLSLVKAGIKSFKATIEGACGLLADVWGLNISRSGLRKYRTELCDRFELFHFESKPFPAGDKGNRDARRSPDIQQFDLLLALLLYEALEIELVERRGVDIDEFPGKGAMVRLLYNRLFDCVSSYRRQTIQDDPAVIYEGGTQIRASDIDWHDNELKSDRAKELWYGLPAGSLTAIPDENGIYPEWLTEDGEPALV